MICVIWAQEIAGLLSHTFSPQKDLQVPVWVTDLGFLPGQGVQSRVVVGTGYHRVRLYDTKTQRRPVLSFDFGESPISAVAVTDDEK